ncbi:hypothetical protein [Rhizobium bangladeshense]|uniref:hypothetical protein n=1 Tax=Rhizobium bangladeshense TaxID=1138189 RepID=UPI001C828B11|nr:hypothetical protein [Rhizobium bangladeshense]MBX4898691.1 hypothetical protein [Rhizobium bangladeshense]MBY3616714.1 UPF0489 family protein [Rhizobium bangladeshense]
MADIDLDIFLDDVSCLDRRPRAPSTVGVWDEKRLRAFLEEKCRLSRHTLQARPRGSFIVHHDAALEIFEDLYCKGTNPLSVIHIDAHSDLGTGFGDLSWMDIGERILGVPAGERTSDFARCRGTRVSPANYLSFALACRWISSLTYVHHPLSDDDLMPFFFKDFDTESGVIEMRHIPSGIRQARSKHELRELPHELEPKITFRREQVDRFRADAPFDHVILCQSPGYTPIEADVLIPIFEDYVDFDVSPSRDLSARTPSGSCVDGEAK